MLLLRISLDLQGDNFSPKGLLSQLKEPFIIFSSNEPSDYKDSNNKDQYEFGSISILHPKKIGIEFELEDYQEWYVNLIEKNYEKFKTLGVKDISLFVDVFYNDQCNFEIFNKNLLKRISDYSISIPISVYNLNKDQLIDLLKDAGYSEKTINTLFG
jgi:hypothetical protein